MKIDKEFCIYRGERVLIRKLGIDKTGIEIIKRGDSVTVDGDRVYPIVYGEIKGVGRRVGKSSNT